MFGQPTSSFVYIFKNVEKRYCSLILTKGKENVSFVPELHRLRCQCGRSDDWKMSQLQ